MEETLVGRSGLRVSRLALGTLTWGRDTDEHEAADQLKQFADAGGTLVDTAASYGEGAAEELLGSLIGSLVPRSDLVLCTKAGVSRRAGVRRLDTSRRALLADLDESLQRLATDHVDLWLVHAWSDEAPLEETLSALQHAVSSGRARYVGLSNYTGWQVQKVVDLAEFKGLARPVTLQPQYNLLVREIEWEIVPACESTGLGLLPWSPLGGGWLTGKYTREERPTGATRLGEDPQRGVEAYDRRSKDERTWDVIDAVEAVASSRGVSMAQVALSWLVDRTMVTSVILGARTVEQLQDNLGAAGLHLSEEETERLDAASDPAPVDYPYGGPGVQQRSRVLEGAED